MSELIQTINGKEDRRSNDSSGRSQSTGSMMQPLSFNRVHEDAAHPLSSLRSCSEFGLNGLNTARQQRGIHTEQKSFWSRLLNWNETEVEDDIFPLNQQARTLSGSSRTSSIYSHTRLHRKQRKKTSVSDEINSALDFVFGFHSNKSIPREIELKDLKDPSIVAQLALHREPTIYPDLPMRRVVSLRTFQRMTLTNNDGIPPRNIEPINNNQRHNPEFNNLCINDWMNYITFILRPYITFLRNYCLEGDNELYYILQSQPFSSGIYLRGMLASGLNNTLFHTYTLLTLPSINYSTSTTSILFYYRISLTLLIFHVILNLIGTPIRGFLHYRCWETTRSVSAEAATQSLQSLIESEIWMINRMIVWSLDILSLITLLFGQIFLWCDTGSSYELSTLIIDICATDILSFLIRVIVALVYFLSFIEDSDRFVLRKKGGLSNFDLDRMPTFVYTTKDDVENDECSICLTTFEMGEMLISLPCHQRHSFHAGCIRQWLSRQNVCPLCHKSC